MRRVITASAVLAALVGVIASTQAAGFGTSTPTTPSAATPLWVIHVARYPGGISSGVRAVYAAGAENRRRECRLDGSAATASGGAGQRTTSRTSR